MSADPAVFLGRVDAEGVIHLDFRQQQVNYCKAKLAGKCVDVIVCEQGELKTRLQEQGFWSMIQPWAREGGHNPTDLKNALLKEIFGERETINPVTGEVVMVLREPHSSKLSRVKYSELIERTLDIAASCGYVLEAPNEYRRRKETEAKRASRKKVAA